MRIRRSIAYVAATAVTSTAVTAGSLFGTAGAQASPAPIVNGILSTVGGCQTSVPELIKFCTQLETLTGEIPIMLMLNPIGTNIVVLGYGLEEDGSMRPALYSRLQAALGLARQFPSAPIITTGGNAHGGHSEAQAMRDWLVQQGISANRITTENRSTDTVGNARNSWELLAARRATGAVVVTSPNHLQRAMINFRTAVGGAIPIIGVVSAG